MIVRVLYADGTPAAGSRVVVTWDHPSGRDLAYRVTRETDDDGWTEVDVARPGSATHVVSPSDETHEIHLPAGLSAADDRTRQLVIRLHRLENTWRTT